MICRISKLILILIGVCFATTCCAANKSTYGSDGSHQEYAQTNENNANFYDQHYRGYSQDNERSQYGKDEEYTGTAERMDNGYSAHSSDEEPGWGEEDQDE